MEIIICLIGCLLKKIECWWWNLYVWVVGYMIIIKVDKCKVKIKVLVL